MSGGKRRARHSQESREILILDHREAAIRLAHSLLKRWRVQLDPDEASAAVDLALCEAASRYQPGRGTQFVTYLFHFLRGELIKVIDQQCSRGVTGYPGRLGRRGAKLPEVFVSGAERAKELGDTFTTQPETPEEHSFRRELRGAAREALSELTDLQRDVVVGVHILGHKLAPYARTLGYSRSHVSAVRREAFRKIEPKLRRFRDAA